MSRYETAGSYSTRGYTSDGSDIQDENAIAIRADAGSTIWMLAGTVELLDKDETWVAKIHPGGLWRWPADSPQDREWRDPYKQDRGPPEAVREGDQDTYDLTPGIADLGHIDVGRAQELGVAPDPGETLHLMMRVPERPGQTVKRYHSYPCGEVTHIVCDTIVDPDNLFRGVEWPDEEDEGNEREAEQ